MKWLFTKEKEWADKWDVFQQSTPRGHYLQMSDWLNSYKSFGFSVEYLIGIDDNENICLGMGFVKAKYSFLKFYVVNCGPIILEGFESYAEEALKLFIDRSKKDGACYCHINFPQYLLEENSRFKEALPINSLTNNSIYFTGKVGTPFKFVSSINGFRWVELIDIDEEKYLSKLSYNYRRQIKESIKKGLTRRDAVTLEDIRTAYTCFEDNAETAGYTIRNWNDFAPYLESSVKKGYSKFIMAYLNDECQGAIWLVKAGQRYNYLMGGTKKDTHNLFVGYFMQYQAILDGLAINANGYDISVGGSKGVTEFKKRFLSEHLEFVGARHWVLSPLKFAIFKYLLPTLQKNKKLISKLIGRG